MTTELKEMSKEIIETVNKRIKLMIKDPEIKAKLLTFECINEAKQWIYDQAVFTLYFSIEEREEIVNKNKARINTNL